jgi:hypothetical protein
MDGLRQPVGSAMSDMAAAKISHRSINGQRHDRTPDDGKAARVPQQDDDDIRVSFGQKLLSASAGSLVTSLIGRLVSPHETSMLIEGQ